MPSWNLWTHINLCHAHVLCMFLWYCEAHSHHFGAVLFLQVWYQIRQANRYITVIHIISEASPIGSTYGIYANIWGILMVDVTIYGIHTDPMGKKLLGVWGVLKAYSTPPVHQIGVRIHATSQAGFRGRPGGQERSAFPHGGSQDLFRIGTSSKWTEGISRILIKGI